jgi:hypothetical protein
MKGSGTADLPLHRGRVPPWLANRMTVLAWPSLSTVVLEYGASEFLTRLSDPFWFQHSVRSWGWTGIHPASRHR